ncbi:unnamed protein product [Urochloa humidicola]
MPLSDRVITGAMRRLAVFFMLFCAAAAISGAVAAAARDVDTFSYPAFDANTTWDLVVASNASVLQPASLLFGYDDGALLSEYNRTEGFLLLATTVDVWRPGAGGVPRLEASFNTSFTLTGGGGGGGAAAVAFVLLRDSFPPLRGQGGLRGFANYTSPDDDVASAAAAGLASVEVGPVRSYGPDDPAVGLNVTVTPNATAAARRTTVWIEYDAAAHRVSVRVAGAGEPRPARALLDAPLDLSGRATSENAFVGFFAATIREVFVGVRDWDLAVENLDGDGKKKKGTSWWVILLAVLGSVAATAAAVTAVVCCSQSRRRRRQLINVQPPKI